MTARVRRRWVALVVVGLAVGAIFVAVSTRVPPERSSPLTALLAAPERIYTRWVPPQPPPTLSGVLRRERDAWKQLGTQISGHLVWSSSRDGNHDLYLVDLSTGAEQKLTSTPGVEFFSRFSPDGQHISFLRSQRHWVSFRDESAWDLFVMNADGSGERRLVEGAYHATWLPDGSGLVYVYENRIFSVDLSSGQVQVLHNGSDPPTNGRVLEPEQLEPGLIAITLREVPHESVGLLDLNAGSYTPLSSGRSCQITWFPGRRQAVWMDPVGQGGTSVMTARLDDLQAETLIDLPGPYSHEYFPRVTYDGKWLVWGASAEGHEHDRADYEVFAWEIGTPWNTATRLTYSPANDQWPDLYISAAP